MTLLSCCMEGLAAVFLLCLLLGACLERKDYRPVSLPMSRPRNCWPA